MLDRLSTNDNPKTNKRHTKDNKTKQAKDKQKTKRKEKKRHTKDEYKTIKEETKKQTIYNICTTTFIEYLYIFQILIVLIQWNLKKT